MSDPKPGGVSHAPLVPPFSETVFSLAIVHAFPFATFSLGHVLVFLTAFVQPVSWLIAIIAVALESTLAFTLALASFALGFAPSLASWEVRRASFAFALGSVLATTLAGAGAGVVALASAIATGWAGSCLPCALG